ncbi:SDR family NAD(P)-dependent oxidoreductase [Calidifontibacter sp. DB0510]|uniref:SDR family NAD(P)-dependent oxidoreductase n=1 Tax=Metallococcus carri TaxID=1656884 RepID=A0A967EA61_9MICO|nr:SDR family NAD(P)-dependent oxidoreductase [Metallococcus carri]NHN57122.1 SDR family NAD(P)-dependent oxidoreductase [Metallococcus carri]NOP39009.1 SDR family NAD(P)-dependent oxidoreductase [Calidifontibacter sp. DB2511S]
MTTGPVLITGASSGVGAATARALAPSGRHLWLLARRTSELESVATDVRAAGGSASVVTCDLRDDNSIDAALATVAADPPGVVVANAGLSIARRVLRQLDRPHDMERSIRVNYLGHTRLILGLLPAMLDRGDGRIVAVTTVGARIATPGWSSYAASKGAFDIWLRSIRPELAPHGIGVSIVELALVRTAMSEPTYGDNPAGAMSPERAAAKVVRAIETGRRLQSPGWARAGAILTAVAPSTGPAWVGRLSLRRRR